tara:strand:- start:745 stop:1353 length:609 start_codon:yes stop_codon:yes gene_type:complete
MLKSDFENLKILVFDLDGTLVQSNQLKEQIFFDIFDTKFHPIIANVLNKYNHASRFEVIDKILIETSNSFSDRDLNQLTSAYSNHLIEKIQNIPISIDTFKNLEILKEKYRLFLSSYTYKNDLPIILKNLKLDVFFEAFFGYPQKKEMTLKNIINKYSVPSNEVMVIGDGESDRISAEKNNCHFFHINDKNTIKLFFKLING